MRATDWLPEQPWPASERRLLEYAWLLLWLACAVAIVMLPGWRTVPLAAAFTAAAWYAHHRAAARSRAAAAAEADRLLTAQRQFLQDTSHQLRTPITIALGHAELLARVLGGRHRRDIGVVLGELERLRVLSERLLLITAAQHPDFLAPALTSLDHLVADQVSRWRPVLANTSTVSANTSSAAPFGLTVGRLDQVTALVDPDRISQALDALIENAVRHTGTGDEITVSVLCEIEKEGRFARIVVQDSGAGIPPADVPHIFDRFMTSTRCGAARGTGLGLTLVKAIARSHGGDAVVQSTLGRGSRFELVLPAQPGGADDAGDLALLAYRRCWPAHAPPDGSRAS